MLRTGPHILLLLCLALPVGCEQPAPPTGPDRPPVVSTSTTAANAATAYPTADASSAPAAMSSRPAAATASARAVVIPARAKTSYIGHRTILDGCKTRAIDPQDPVDGGGWDCAVFGGYKLDINFGDERVFLSIVPKGNKPKFQSIAAVTGGAFSGIDGVIEWRVPSSDANAPATVIASVNWGFPIVGRAFLIYLLTEEGSCLAATVDVSYGNSRVRARALADRIASLDSCPSPPLLEKITKPMSTKL